MRVRNEGHFSSGGFGDLYLHLAVKRHPTFERDGDDIKCKVRVSFLKAILGGELEVPALSRTVKMKIPAGTQPNAVFRLKGKGIANLRTKRIGDEFVEVEVEIPRRLSLREKKLLEQWSSLKKEDL